MMPRSLNNCQQRKKRRKKRKREDVSSSSVETNDRIAGKLPVHFELAMLSKGYKMNVFSMFFIFVRSQPINKTVWVWRSNLDILLLIKMEFIEIL